MCNTYNYEEIIYGNIYIYIYIHTHTHTHTHTHCNKDNKVEFMNICSALCKPMCHECFNKAAIHIIMCYILVMPTMLYFYVSMAKHCPCIYCRILKNISTCSPYMDMYQILHYILKYIFNFCFIRAVPLDHSPYNPSSMQTEICNRKTFSSSLLPQKTSTNHIYMQIHSQMHRNTINSLPPNCL